MGVWDTWFGTRKSERVERKLPAEGTAWRQLVLDNQARRAEREAMKAEIIEERRLMNERLRRETRVSLRLCVSYC